jgi:hypothetical protein
MLPFLTFTSKEMSSLEWTKFEKLQEWIKNIQMNMTWKDFLVECAILFHSWFEKFIKNDIIFNNGVIGKVEHVIWYMGQMLKELWMKLLHLYLQH